MSAQKRELQWQNNGIYLYNRKFRKWIHICLPTDNCFSVKVWRTHVFPRIQNHAATELGIVSVLIITMKVQFVNNNQMYLFSICNVNVFYANIIYVHIFIEWNKKKKNYILIQHISIYKANSKKKNLTLIAVYIRIISRENIKNQKYHQTDKSNAIQSYYYRKRYTHWDRHSNSKIFSILNNFSLFIVRRKK